MPGRRWTAAEDDRLMTLIESGVPLARVTRAFPDRTALAVWEHWHHTLRRRYPKRPPRNAQWLADLLGVKPCTVRQWLRIGYIRAQRGWRRLGAGQGEWHISNADVAAFLADWHHWPRWSVEGITDPWWRAYAREFRDGTRFLTLREASRVVPWSWSVIRRACKQGALPATRVGVPGLNHTRWMIRETDLRAWAERRIASVA